MSIMGNLEDTTVWIYGLSGAGKTTISERLIKKIRDVTLVDADIFRKQQSSDLGYSMEDRAENIRRAAEYCSKIEGNVIASFITPTRELRQAVREIHDKNNKKLILVYLDVPVSVCAKRDPKGLYKRAYSGELKQFTGIDSPFEVPFLEDGDLIVANHGREIDERSIFILHKILSFI